MPTLFDFINRSKVNLEKLGITALKISIANKVCRDKKIKKNNLKETFSDTNLLLSYKRILKYQIGDKNKAKARMEAINLLYPKLNPSEFANKDEALRKEADRKKNNQSLNYLYPDDEPIKGKDNDLVELLLFAEGIENDLPIYDNMDRVAKALDRMRNKYALGDIDKVEKYSI